MFFHYKLYWLVYRDYFKYVLIILVGFFWDSPGSWILIIPNIERLGLHPPQSSTNIGAPGNGKRSPLITFIPKWTGINIIILGFSMVNGDYHIHGGTPIHQYQNGHFITSMIIFVTWRCPKIHGGTSKWTVYDGKYHEMNSSMDDLGYPYFRTPPRVKEKNMVRFPVDWVPWSNALISMNVKFGW